MPGASILEQQRFHDGQVMPPLLEDLEQTPIIDVDSHISEPPDLWTSRVSVRKWGDLVPHVKWVENRSFNIGIGAEPGLAWFVGDEMISVAPAGAAGKDLLRLIPPDKPADYEETHPAAYIATERLKLMNECGIYAQAIYPNVAGFGAQQFLHKIKEPELRIELVRAYNDFLYEWASVAPARFILNCAVPFWDVQETVREIRRCKDMGFRGILFASRPHLHGQPWIGERHWDPLWDVATECDMPINFHIGTGNTEDFFKPLPGMTRRTIFTTACALIFLSNAHALVELVMSGVLQRYPKLRFVSVESGIGFLPFVMEAMDHEFLACRMWEERPEFELLPSEYFRRHIYSCFWFEESGPKRLIDYLGEDRVLFETDFPHTTKLYPASSVKAHIARSLGEHKPATRRKLLAENAAELYRVELPADQSWREQVLA